MNHRPKPLRIPDLHSKKQAGQKITMLTAYDAAIARLISESGAVDMLLVGDSLGMVQLGYSTTVPVTMSDMVHHTKAVRRGAPDAFIVADLPFLAGQISTEEALRNAGRLMQAGANAVKIEGATAILPAVERAVSAGIPVMGHLGLQPQSVNAVGGFRKQAKTEEEQQRAIAQGRALQAAGAFSIVLEMVPDELGRNLAQALSVPVIGIGAGPDCDGQVLVINDILGLSGAYAPGFAKLYANGGADVEAAVRAFAEDVRSGRFPQGSGQHRLATVQHIAELRAELQNVRRAGRSIGFVPTMGALHAGHAKLLAQARKENDFVVASIFVNPLQFDRQEDLAKYPRTWEADLEICRAEKADLVWAPQANDLYPRPQMTFVESPELSRFLEGEHRPGHFRGVATVVLKLFNAVQPDRAYFGEKDAQQLAIIQQMVRDLEVPVQIVPVPTLRDHDGLALSSRNKLLSPEQRKIAPGLHKALLRAVQLLNEGERSVARMRPEIENVFREVSPELRLEYFEWVHPDTLVPLTTVEERALIVTAAWLGTTRLIDNMRWNSPKTGQTT